MAVFGHSTNSDVFHYVIEWDVPETCTEEDAYVGVMCATTLSLEESRCFILSKLAPAGQPVRLTVDAGKKEVSVWTTDEVLPLGAPLLPPSHPSSNASLLLRRCCTCAISEMRRILVVTHLPIWRRCAQKSCQDHGKHTTSATDAFAAVPLTSTPTAAGGRLDVHTPATGGGTQRNRSEMLAPGRILGDSAAD